MVRYTNISLFKKWVLDKLEKIDKSKDVEDGEVINLVIAIDSKSFTNKSKYKNNIKLIIDNIYKTCLSAFNDGSKNADEGKDAFLEVYCYIIANQTNFKNNLFHKIENINNLSFIYNKLELKDNEDASLTTLSQNELEKRNSANTFYVVVSDFEFREKDDFTYLSKFRTISTDRVFYFVLVPSSFKRSQRAEKFKLMRKVDKNPVDNTSFIYIQNLGR